MKNSWIAVAAAGILLVSCNRNTVVKTESKQADSVEIAHFVADESFAPILDQELYVFKNVQSRDGAEITYHSENDALQYLLNGSINFAFLSRNLNADEKKTLKEKNLIALETKFAIDAIAIIVNGSSNDTTISVGEIKNMLLGQAKTDKNIVFDNPNSSLVRYLKDMIGGKDLKQKNIYALKSNKDVIQYVSKHPDAIGIIGFNWLNDPDSDYADAAKSVKIVSVRNENSKDAPDQYFSPSQSTLSLGQYPLVRELYIINSINSSNGAGAEFEHFLVSDRGQRIVLRSGLLPAKIPGREVRIHSNKL